jgi:hypothetical protein
MEYEELKELNSEKPRKALLYKALMEFQGAIEFYQSEYDKDKRRYWQGKILEQKKWKKAVVEKLEKIYNTKITNP